MLSIIKLHKSTTLCFPSVFTTVQLEPKLHTAQLYKQIRSHGKFRSRAKVPETPFPSSYIEKGPIHFSRMWKPFAFTIIVSKTRTKHKLLVLTLLLKKVNAVGYKAIEFSYISKIITTRA